MVTLKRSCVPDTVDVPIKLIVPAVAVNLPAPPMLDLTEKLVAVLNVFGTCIPKNVVDPVPATTGVAPENVIVPFVALKVPVVVKLPATGNETAVLTVPDTITL